VSSDLEEAILAWGKDNESRKKLLDALERALDHALWPIRVTAAEGIMSDHQKEITALIDQTRKLLLRLDRLPKESLGESAQESCGS